MDKQQGPTVWHRELYSIFCDKSYGKEYFKKRGCLYVYNYLTVPYSGDWHNTVNELEFF